MESKVVYDIFHLVYWDWRVVLDLFLGGLGVGAFLYAIVLMVYKKDDKLLSVRIGSILGPIAMIAGLLFLLSEMGEPIRIYKTIIRFNLTSTQSWGGIIQEGFILFSGIYAFLLFTGKKKEIRDRIAVFAGFFAMFVAWYHGFLLTFITARPLWNNGASSVAQVIMSLNTGVCGVMLIAFLSKRGREEMKGINSVLRNFLIISLVVLMTTCLLWLLSLIHGKLDFVNAYRLLNRDFGLLFWVGAVIIGLVLPVIVLSLYSIGPRRDKLIPVPLVSLLILAGGFMFRYVLVIGGQLS